MNYALVGYGRMGRAVESQAARRGHRLVATFDSGNGLERWTGDHGGIDVAFEFTRPEVAEGNVVRLLERGIPVVCGTTGWQASPGAAALFDAEGSALVVAPNFSIGMVLFQRIVHHAAEQLGRAGRYDPFIEEAHHRGKRDVPSGTALRLASTVLEALDGFDGVVEGHPTGPMPEGKLQVVGRRAGHEPGSHVVGFDGEEDQILLTHRARGRGGFALGAVLAAEWLVGHRGRHSFEQVLDAILAADSGGGTS